MRTPVALLLPVVYLVQLVGSLQLRAGEEAEALEPHVVATVEDCYRRIGLPVGVTPKGQIKCAPHAYDAQVPTEKHPRHAKEGTLEDLSTSYMPPAELVSTWNATELRYWRAAALKMGAGLDHVLRTHACMKPSERTTLQFKFPHGAGEMLMEHSSCVAELLTRDLPLALPMPKIRWAEVDKTFSGEGCEGRFDCFFEDFQPEPSTCALLESPKNTQRSAGEMLLEFERSWGSVLYASAIQGWYWRPQPMLAERLKRDMDVIGVAPGMDCIAMQIRHGDSCGDNWRSCAPLSEYMEAAKRMRRLYGYSKIFLATDDAAVIEEAQSYKKHFTLLYNRKLDRTKLNPASYGKGIKGPPTGFTAGGKDWIEHHLENDELGQTPFYDVLLDVSAASSCRAFVGSFDASLSHLIFSRMVFREGMIVPYKSVGGQKYCRKSGYASCCLGGLAMEDTGNGPMCNIKDHHFKMSSSHVCNTR